MTISSGNGSNLARLSSSALSRSRCRFDGFPGLKIRLKKTRLSNEYLISEESCPIKYIQVAHFPKPRSNFRWEYTTQTSHHVQAQVGQSSVFHLTILTPTRNTNQQTAHDTNPWVFFFRLSLLFAFTSMNSESARVAKVLLFPLLQRKIQTVDSEFARHCAASHWSL